MSDSAYDAQGDPYNNFQDMTVRIQDNPFYVQRQANQAQALQLDISQIYPVGQYSTTFDGQMLTRRNSIGPS
jgi:hypothetical protein